MWQGVRVERRWEKVNLGEISDFDFLNYQPKRIFNIFKFSILGRSLFLVFSNSQSSAEAHFKYFRILNPRPKLISNIFNFSILDRSSFFIFSRSAFIDSGRTHVH